MTGPKITLSIFRERRFSIVKLNKPRVFHYQIEITSRNARLDLSKSFTLKVDTEAYFVV